MSSRIPRLALLAALVASAYAQAQSLPAYEFRQKWSAPIQVVTTRLDLSATALSFSSVLLGQTSSPKSVLLTNSGGTTITVSSVSASGPFQSSHNCTSIAPGTSCALSVSFAPTEDGAASGALSIETNAGTREVTLTGAGQGIPAGTLDITAKTYNAGNGTYLANQTVIDQVVRLTSTGTAALRLNAAPSLTGSSDFSLLSTTCSTSATYAKDAFCEATYRYAPLTTTLQSATLSFDTNAGTKTVSLQGQAQKYGGTVSPAANAASIGDVLVGQAGGRTFTFTNEGTLPVTGVYAAYSGDAALTLQNNTCGTSASKVTIAAGASCSVTVYYAPTATGSASGTLNLYSPLTPGFSYSAPVTATAVNGSLTTQTFNYSGTINTSFVAPKSGTYIIEVWGAQSGPRVNYSWSVDTRGGAYMKCAAYIEQGTQLKILVGGQGSTSSGNIGGGGGTFVTTSTNVPLAVGGGGGGGWANYSGTGGQVTNNGTTLGGSGAGLTGDGSCGAKSFVNGGAGQGLGGFGGGGGSGACGGGGGYNGGGNSQYAGYGGGSYCQMATLSSAANSNFSGHGKVVIGY